MRYCLNWIDTTYNWERKNRTPPRCHVCLTLIHRYIFPYSDWGVGHHYPWSTRNATRRGESFPLMAPILPWAGPVSPDFLFLTISLHKSLALWFCLHYNMISTLCSNFTTAVPAITSVFQLGRKGKKGGRQLLPLTHTPGTGHTTFVYIHWPFVITWLRLAKRGLAF